MRGANVVVANPQRRESPDGLRRALGRNVKGESPRGRGYYEAVEVWTLKEKRDGRWVVVDTHCSREKAEGFVQSSSHNCWEEAVQVKTDGPIGHGWECGKCGAFLQAG